jgi:integrase
MATLKAVVDHRKADGTYNVKIRLTHNRKALYIPTELYITERQMTRSKKIKDPNIVSATDSLIDEMRKAIASIPHIEYMECSQLREALRRKMSEGEVFRLDFFDYADSKITKMSENTQIVYRTSFNRLKKFRGSLDVNDIDYRFITSFKVYLEQEGVANNGIAVYLSKIKHIFNLAKEDYNDDDIVRVKTSPFKRGVVPKEEATEHKVLSVEQVRRLSTINCDKSENFARDMFLLSFCLIGINGVDLYHLKKDNVKDGVLTYNRRKTKSRRRDKALISVRIEPEAAALIEKYSSDDKDDYLLNLHRRYSLYSTMRTSVNLFLKRLRQYDKTLPNDLYYYYARHTWATIAYNDCGIDMQTIHEALNHASDANMKITDVYVKKDFSRIWEANRKVLDYVFGSDNK